MHLGRKYKFTQFLGWTSREILYLVGWALLVTAFLAFTHWDFLTIPASVLTIIGAALAIGLGFKNQQCYGRFGEALVLAEQLVPSSLILANKLTSATGTLDPTQCAPTVTEIFYRHFAWLTALRFSLRAKKPWENTSEAGNARYLMRLPTPESQSNLEDQLRTYLPDDAAQKMMTHPGEKECLVLHWQYEAIGDLHKRKLINDAGLLGLTAALDDLARLQGGLQRTKKYPYARNYYSIAVILVTMYAAMVPFGLFASAQELGAAAGIGFWTAWLNVPLSVIVGWVFVSLEKVGENSSNPFEGGPNDVPISSIARRIEIEMRLMLGEQTSLKPLETKDNVLF